MPHIPLTEMIYDFFREIWLSHISGLAGVHSEHFHRRVPPRNLTT
jgi:hypothetical protein